jgi:hypothetical protein
MVKRVHAGVLLVATVLFVPLLVLAQTQDPWIGTWKLNVAKSKYEPGDVAPQSMTMRQEAAAGGAVRTVVDTVNGQGRTQHLEFMVTFDGKPVAISGAPTANTTRMYKRLDSRSYEYVTSVAGKQTATVRAVVSADGKTRTHTTTGRNAQGQTINRMEVLEKQERCGASAARA